MADVLFVFVQLGNEVASHNARVVVTGIDPTYPDLHEARVKKISTQGLVVNVRWRVVI